MEERSLVFRESIFVGTKLVEALFEKILEPVTSVFGSYRIAKRLRLARVVSKVFLHIFERFIDLFSTRSTQIIWGIEATLGHGLAIAFVKAPLSTLGFAIFIDEDSHALALLFIEFRHERTLAAVKILVCPIARRHKHRRRGDLQGNSFFIRKSAKTLLEQKIDRVGRYHFRDRFALVKLCQDLFNRILPVVIVIAHVVVEAFESLGKGLHRRSMQHDFLLMETTG